MEKVRNKKLSAAEITVIVLGCIILVAVCVLVGMIIHKRRRDSLQRKQPIEDQLMS